MHHERYFSNLTFHQNFSPFVGRFLKNSKIFYWMFMPKALLLFLMLTRTLCPLPLNEKLQTKLVQTVAFLEFFFGLR